MHSANSIERKWFLKDFISCASSISGRGCFSYNVFSFFIKYFVSPSSFSISLRETSLKRAILIFLTTFFKRAILILLKGIFGRCQFFTFCFFVLSLFQKKQKFSSVLLLTAVCEEELFYSYQSETVFL